jgi:enoyl-CoA hydratase/carnithine racemase
MNYSSIQYELIDHVAIVRLSRPDRLNAWTPTMGEELADAMSQAAMDPEVKAIVVTGAGRSFCAGMDYECLSQLEENRLRKRETKFPQKMPRASGRVDFEGLFNYFPAIGKPVIGAINGPAAGSGLVLALSCDVRFASESAVFASSFVRHGLVAEHGVAWLLTRMAGTANALDLLLTGRKVDALEAKALGLVNFVCKPDEMLGKALHYARDLADTCSPRSLRIIKRQVWNASMETLAESTTIANQEMPDAFDSEDFREALRARTEARQPHFTGL